MYRRFIPLVVIIFSIILALSGLSSRAYAAPSFADSAYDLINAVNALRGSNGLPAYSSNSILMYTAQNQADFMAANEMVTHYGPGGISLTSRILAAGYPLAGDLSLGGFRAENIISGGEGMSAQAAVQAWMGDAPHLNTMLSPNLTEIGAGVAVKNGSVYDVIDAARPTTSGASQAVTPVYVDGTAVSPYDAPISAVVVSTPNADGDVIHVVQFGQSLWQIAIDYGVRIDDIKRLNNLVDDNIFPGEWLLVRKDAVVVTVMPLETPSVAATVSLTLSALPRLTDTLMPTDVFTSTPVSGFSGKGSSMIAGVVLGIIALALLGGGLLSRLGVVNNDR